MFEASFGDDDPAARLAWLRHQTGRLAEVAHPGCGATRARFATLAAIGRLDGSLGRLAEGHLDALAILAELGSTAVDRNALRGVWAARPDHVAVTARGSGWALTGRKPWCSGATGLDRALLTGIDADGRPRLFDVAVDELEFDDDWHPIGMRASDSRTALIDVVVAPEAEIGAPGAYLDRPGFGHGGVGVAAVWHGLARRLAVDLAEHAAGRNHPYLQAAAGRAAALSFSSSATLRIAADEIDAGPLDTPAARRRAPLVRVAVEHAARAVLEASVVAQGATSLCFDPPHARAVADLTVYLGQLHDGYDAAGIDPDDDRGHL